MSFEISFAPRSQEQTVRFTPEAVGGFAPSISIGNSRDGNQTITISQGISGDVYGQQPGFVNNSNINSRSTGNRLFDLIYGSNRQKPERYGFYQPTNPVQTKPPMTFSLTLPGGVTFNISFGGSKDRFSEDEFIDFSDPSRYSIDKSRQFKEFEPVDSKLAEVMKDISGKTGTCYNAVWRGLVESATRYPNSPWGKIFSYVDQETQKHAAGAKDFPKAMEPLIAKDLVKNISDQVNGPEDVPAGAIVVVSPNYFTAGKVVSPNYSTTGKAAIYGDISVKMEDGTFKNYATMGFKQTDPELWNKENNYIMGVYIPAKNMSKDFS